MRFFLIAGEASGDQHAANLIRALQQRHAESRFAGLGGECMRKAGCLIVQDYKNMAFMGVAAVLAHLGEVRRNFRIARTSLLHEKPDVLILVDYPSFNLRMAAFCRKHLPGTRIVYYIPPKVWAWKTWRIHRIARLCDLVLGIFPFEPAFYARYGHTCRYVGNPTLDNIRAREQEQTNARPRENLIALLPGSRRSEIEHCLPVMLEAARRAAQEKKEPGEEPPRIAVAAAPGIEDPFYNRWLDGETLTRDTYELVSRARSAVVNSGTATLETALLGCPQTAVYHVACSKWLGWLKPLIFSTRFFTLVNIIPDKEVIQELVGARFSRRNIEDELRRLTDDTAYRQRMQENYAVIRRQLGEQNAADQAAEAICSLSSQTNQ